MLWLEFLLSFLGCIAPVAYINSCPSLLSIAMINLMTKLGEEMACFRMQLLFIMEGSQGKNLEAGIEAEIMEEHHLPADLLLKACLAQF